MTQGDVASQAPVNRREHLRYALVGLGSAAYLYPFLRVLWRVGDEGTLVYGAQRVAEGAVPYRDFMEVMGPGTFYWLGLFFKIFGATWLVARAEVLITGVATTLVLYWLARRLRPGSGSLVAILLTAITFPLWPATSHHWDSNLFALLSFAVFVAWLDNSRPWLAVTAGVLCGITTLFMQQKGLLLLFSCLLILYLLRRKQPDFASSAARLLAGYGGVVAVVVLAFCAAGALPQFVYANIVWPFTHYSSVNAAPYGYGLREWFWNAWCGLLLSLFRPAVAYTTASVFAVPFLVVAALPALLVALANAGRGDACNRATLPYWIAGSALWLSEIHRSDITHLIYGSPLLLILCISLWQQRQDRFWRSGVRVLAVSVVLFAVFNVLVAQAARTKMVTRRGAVYTFADDAALEFLDRQTQPGEDVFVYPYYPMYYFLSGTTNPTRFSILLYHNNTDAQFQEVISALERRKVRYVLWDTVVDGQNLKQWFPNYQQPPREKLMIEPYLKAHYDLIGIKNGFRVLQRKDTMVAAGSQPAAAPGL
jgi:hypothetical protein